MPDSLSPLDFFGAAPDAPRIDINEHVAIAVARTFIRQTGARETVFPAYVWNGQPIRPGQGPYYTPLCSCSAIPEASGRIRITEDRMAWAYLLLADDIGSRVPLARAEHELKPPTAIVETSPQNYQWVWGLRPRANPAQLRLALQMLAAAGLTDPLSLFANRLARIPGSLNAKRTLIARHGRPWIARVVEFHPARLYALEELVPDLASYPMSSAWQRPRTPFDGKLIEWDDTYQWLDAHDMVKRAPDASGWARIRCPWEAGHDASASNAARYAGWLVRIGVGRFHCSQCWAKRTQDLLAWIRQQDAAFSEFATLLRAFPREARHG